MQSLFADGKPHSNSEIKRRTNETSRMIEAARGWMRDRGTFLYPSTELGEGWWQTTEDVTLIRPAVLRRTLNWYSESCRQYRATAGVYSRNPTDIALHYELLAQQSMCSDLGTRLGKTLAEIAADLTLVA
jgi:hypothetical protein